MSIYLSFVLASVKLLSINRYRYERKRAYIYIYNIVKAVCVNTVQEDLIRMKKKLILLLFKKKTVCFYFVDLDSVRLQVPSL